jgi:hypothetical protein
VLGFILQSGQGNGRRCDECYNTKIWLERQASGVSIVCVMLLLLVLQQIFNGGRCRCVCVCVELIFNLDLEKRLVATTGSLGASKPNQ